MKLHVSDILYMLENKRIFVATGLRGTETFIEKNDKRRREFVSKLSPAIQSAEKFIFDSGQDQDIRTVKAIRETAVNMMQAGLFHMPHKNMWIEDPFTDNEADTMSRNFYLVNEHENHIVIRFMQRFKENPDILIIHTNPLIIDLKQTEYFEKFGIPEGCATEIDDFNAKLLAEAVYSVKKMVVILATKDTIIERVRREKERTGGDHRRRTYPHSIIRVPFETTVREPETGSSASDSEKKRRKHLVRGFVWGKNTRPVEQQRWIAPYWRGDQDVGVVQHDHYEV